jgi:hypothetical protein
MSQESNRIQARNFTENYTAASLVTATTIFLGRRAIERSIRGLGDYLQETLPRGNLLEPGTAALDDDSYLVHLGPTYEYIPLNIRARHAGEPAINRWGAIESASGSPIHVLSLITGRVAESTGLFALRTSGENYQDEVPVYFALSKEGTRLDELQTAEVTAGLPLHLHLATGQPTRGPHGEEIIQLPEFPGEEPMF